MKLPGLEPPGQVGKIGTKVKQNVIYYICLLGRECIVNKNANRNKIRKLLWLNSKKSYIWKALMK